MSWDNEDFEDALTRAVIAIYESPAKETITKKAFKGGEFFHHGEREILDQVRKELCFWDNDSIVLIEKSPKLHLACEPLPDRFCISMSHWMSRETAEKAENEYSYSASPSKIYFGCVLGIKTKILPKAIIPLINGTHYKFYEVHFTGHGFFNTHGFYTVGTDGLIMPVFLKNKYDYQPCPECLTDAKLKHDMGMMFYTHIQAYNNRRFRWLVDCIDQQGKIQFQIGPEEVKSLFFSRELPITTTGRKAPLLHWVRSHKRRVKEQIEIDIEKHLRGRTEFIMDDMKFIISQPQKKQEVAA